MPRRDKRNIRRTGDDYAPFSFQYKGDRVAYAPKGRFGKPRIFTLSLRSQMTKMVKIWRRK